MIFFVVGVKKLSAFDVGMLFGDVLYVFIFEGGKKGAAKYLKNAASSIIEKISDSDVIKEEYDTFSYELTQIQHDAVKIGGKIDKNEARYKHIESELENIDSKIHQYYEHEEKIKKNKILNEQISTLTDKLSSLQIESISVDK